MSKQKGRPRRTDHPQITIGPEFSSQVRVPDPYRIHLRGEIDPSSRFELGDKVILDAGQSGEWGPGTVTAIVEFDDGWEGYFIEFPITNDQNFGLGWIGSSLLKPASDSEVKQGPTL